MTTKIIQKFPIEERNLDKSNYWQSYLDEALRLGMLSREQIQDMQVQIVNLVAKQIQRYTHGESSSVKVEVAGNIMKSILYSVDAYLKSLSDLQYCLEVLKSMSLLDIYKEGLQLIKKQVEEASIVLSQVEDNRVDIDNYAYNDTLNEALPQFFSFYDPEFFAHDTMASIDYPLCIDKMDEVGIEYIRHYLEKLFWENEFCNHFSKESITSLLESYHSEHQELLINIFQLVLTNSLGLVLLRKSIESLEITFLDCISLESFLKAMTPIDQDRLIKEAVNQLVGGFDNSRFLKCYMTEALSEISIRFKNALANNQLDSLLVVLKSPKLKQDIHFEGGEVMSNTLFKALTEEMRTCRYLSDRLVILRKEVHSLKDMVDILEADVFLKDEYKDVFSSLSEVELAVLLKRLNIRDDDAFEQSLDFMYYEKDWENELLLFLKQKDKDTLNRIMEFTHRIGLSNEEITL